ncbi:LPS assembly lipoprotein LptE [Meridianimarinicoccus aquatilis]|uniref:LPS-assembly lipoprotein n=1 Tax=Meridianimarinicoccus aquatilis TaxID=2552766 RepID=A0A4R6AKK8_9RHOB|nr:LPS assembly lipoprotein LptE [Fluviibacterium aquatile]TDL84500.1 hypothetical protein E2L05_18040 [Fluviibacterium aquatile]
MSWSDAIPASPGRRAILAAFFGTALAACGFTPVYAPGSTGAALDGTVEVALAGGSSGFTLTEALQDRLGAPGSSPRFRLTPSLGVSSERVAITTAQSTNRYNLIGTVSYTLTELASGEQRASGRIDGFNSYSAIGSSVATATAEADAYDRLMIILADKVVADLLVKQGLAQ